MKAVRIIFLAAIVLPAAVFASSTGFTGRTLKTSTSGCSCHGSNPATSVSVLIAGPSSLKPGATGAYTVTVTDVAGTSGGGVDISASTGILAPVSTFLQLLNGELTHMMSLAVPTTYNFTYTAPSAAGVVTLYATGKGTAFTAWNFATNFIVSVTTATAVSPPVSAPVSYGLEQNYPNPFNPSTEIRFSIAEEQQATLAVYDIQGREVASLIDSRLQPGTYSAVWNAQNMPSGVYFYRLKAGQFTETKKLLLQK
jgi:hypothetical protein